MDGNNNQPPKSNDQTLQLPDDGSAVPLNSQEPNQAAELIRQKVQAAYAVEPDAGTEAQDVSELGSSLARTKHQQFIYSLSGSGKSLPEIQAAWHEYYTSLPDVEKHQVWQEFYSSHAQASHSAGQSSIAPKSPDAQASRPAYQAPGAVGGKLFQSITELKKALLSLPLPRRRARTKPTSPAHSLLFGLGVGGVVVFIFMFSFFNERFIAPLIQPSRSVTGTPIIASNVASGNDPEIIIPKINVEIPVVYGVETIDESAIQNALEGGVVHYADTAVPGQGGNVVIVGHSSNNIFNSGKYKFAFVLLSRLEKADTFYLDKDGKRYTYEVFEKKIVKPNDVSVLGPTSQPAAVTLITCDPPGTSTNRLVVVGRQINPDPATNGPQVAQNSLATQTAVVPGNPPSLWSRLFSWL